jgi:hypothetical protein
MGSAPQIGEAKDHAMHTQGSVFSGHFGQASLKAANVRSLNWWCDVYGEAEAVRVYY